ncbi:MAG: M55 family metallopeptidase, partial [Dehalococcoidia bacterium]
MPLKVYISVDLEGISGVVHGDHTARDGKDYDMARRLMTLETNAAIEGAVDAGADEVVVNDSHGTMRNLLPEMLEPHAALITGTPKTLTQMAGVDDSYGAVLCVGYHARSGTQGILSHTISSRVIYDLRINGQSQGELGINAGIAGY